MKNPIESVDLYRYKLPFAQPLRLAKTVLTVREVLLLKWQYLDQVFWTEVAPLPGYSPEHIQDARQSLHSFFASEPAWYPELLANRLDERQDALPASVSMGLAAFLLELEPSFFGVPVICPLLVNGDFDHPSRLAEIREASVLKVKVGDNSLDQDIEQVNWLCRDSGFTGVLRLDVNQRWTVEQVEQVCACVDTRRIQWLEDPLPEPEAYRDWRSFSTIDYALDEPLYRSSRLPKQFCGLRALIIKPSLMGMQRVVQLCDWAYSQNVELIFSSCFETPVGIRTLYALANKHARQAAHGFDTLKYFAEVAENQPDPSLLNFDAQLF